MAHLQAEVPHEIQHVFHRAQGGGRGFVRRQEQQVNIAERRQHGAAVAAGGGDGHPVLQGRAVADFRGGMGEQHAHRAVRERGEPLRRLHARHAVGFELIANMLLDAREVPAERGQHGIPRRARAIGAAELGQGLGEHGGDIFRRAGNGV